MDRAEPNLLPRPRHMSRGEGTAPAVVTESAIDVPGLPAEGYRVTIGPSGARIEAADAAGMAHARRTLDQLGTLGRLGRCARSRTGPTSPTRGVMIDVSRDKVPTMATLESLIDQLASWKVNHVELYVEHTFAHPGFEEVWADASPFTPAEIEHLDRFCAERFIELVPQQNTLGHMERYLDPPPVPSHGPRTRRVHVARLPAATAGDARSAPGRCVRAGDAPRRPTGARCCPDARQVHVGLDEPWELGEDLLGDYVAWMTRLRALPALDGRDVLVHGDVLAAHPDLIPALPSGVTVTEWGYEANHPWEERLGRLADAGVARSVMCGTSSWSSLLGRTTNMIGNIAGAVDAALADGGVDAVVNTDWGDWGHLQHLPVSMPGFAWGAAQTWCRSSNRDLDLGAALDDHCREATGPGWGATMLALGDAHRAWGPMAPNIASCFLNLFMNQLPVRGVDRSAPEAVRAALDAAVALGDPGPELSATVELARLLLDDDEARLAGDGRIESVPEATRRVLDAGMGDAIEVHRAMWLRRNRPGGLEDSVAWLENLRGQLSIGPKRPGMGGSAAGALRPDQRGSRCRGCGETSAVPSRWTWRWAVMPTCWAPSTLSARSSMNTAWFGVSASASRTWWKISGSGLAYADLGGVEDDVELVEQVEDVKVSAKPGGSVGQERHRGRRTDGAEEIDHVVVDQSHVRLPQVERADAAVAMFGGHADPDLVHPLAVGEHAGHRRSAELVAERDGEDRLRFESERPFHLVESFVVPLTEDTVEVEDDCGGRFRSGLWMRTDRSRHTSVSGVGQGGGAFGCFGLGSVEIGDVDRLRTLFTEEHELAAGHRFAEHLLEGNGVGGQLDPVRLDLGGE